MCLNRNDKDPFNKTSSSTEVTNDQWNFNLLLPNVTNGKLHCDGKESYSLGNLCNLHKSFYQPCTLPNGNMIQLNPK